MVVWSVDVGGDERGLGVYRRRRFRVVRGVFRVGVVFREV